MGTFNDALKRWFFQNDSSAADSGGYYIPMLNAQGQPIGCDTPSRIATHIPFTTGNVGMVHKNGSLDDISAISRITPEDYVGAWIFEGGHLIIVSKDVRSETQMKWSNTQETGGNRPKTDIKEALSDFDGRSNTTNILNTLGANAPAATYCNEYYPSNVQSSNSNFGAGKWYLPSVGELFSIYAHGLELERILRALGSQRYTSIKIGSWCSTEYSTTQAWGSLITFNPHQFYKDFTGYVIPVTTLT